MWEPLPESLVAQEMFKATCLHAQIRSWKILSLSCMQNVLGFGESGNRNSGRGPWIEWQQRELELSQWEWKWREVIFETYFRAGFDSDWCWMELGGRGQGPSVRFWEPDLRTRLAVFALVGAEHMGIELWFLVIWRHIKNSQSLLILKITQKIIVYGDNLNNEYS